MLEFCGNIVEGGWGALSNITAGIGKGASTLVSGFFPAQQREKVEHLPIEPAGGTGDTYRPTAPDAPSFWETVNMAAQQWLHTPFEQQYSIPAKRTESTQLADLVTSGPPAEPVTTLADILAAGPTFVREVKTIADDWMDALGYGRRETDIGTPRSGYPEGTDVQHLNQAPWMGANVIETFTTFGKGILNQVKGLFNLGYSGPNGVQPVLGIRHELQPTAKTTIGLVVGAVALVIILLLAKKK